MMSPLPACATLLLVVFVCFQNACSSRPHAFKETTAIVHDEDTSLKSNQADNTTDHHKLNPTATEDSLGLQTASSGTRKPSKKESNNDNMVEIQVGATSHKRRSTIKRSSMKMMSYQAKNGGGGTKVKYRVPHRKRGEQQPGFNLDYSPPKVHPPHHN